MDVVGGKITQVSFVAILPGSFHPPTVAHLGLAERALERVERVVFTLPRAFPHKSYESVGLEARLELLKRLTKGEARFAVAVSEGGLFVEMARELRELCPEVKELFLLCGRDAAERIVGWPYGEGDSIERQLTEFSLLVGSRMGEFTPPEHLGDRVELLKTEWDDISSTRVREAMNNGEDWRSMVPGSIHDRVEALYSPSRLDSRNVRRR